MLTGNNARTAEAMAHEVSVEHVLPEIPRDQDADRVKKLRGQDNIVGLVRDGINNASALAQSDLGVAIGTDMAMAASDITLIGGDIRTIMTAIALARRTVGTPK